MNAIRRIFHRHNFRSFSIHPFYRPNREPVTLILDECGACGETRIQPNQLPL